MSWLPRRNTAPRPPGVLNPHARTSRSASPESGFITISNRPENNISGWQVACSSSDVPQRQQITSNAIQQRSARRARHGHKSSLVLARLTHTHTHNLRPRTSEIIILHCNPHLTPRQHSILARVQAVASELSTPGHQPIPLAHVIRFRKDATSTSPSHHRPPPRVSEGAAASSLSDRASPVEPIQDFAHPDSGYPSGASGSLSSGRHRSANPVPTCWVDIHSAGPRHRPHLAGLPLTSHCHSSS